MKREIKMNMKQNYELNQWDSNIDMCKNVSYLSHHYLLHPFLLTCQQNQFIPNM